MGSNVYAAILAGGCGSRMGNPEKPKQFLMLGGKPLFVHTVEKFCASGEFDAVLLLCPEVWLEQTKDLLKKYSPDFAGMISVTTGGETRNDTVMNAVHYIEQNYEVDESTVIVTHDAVRPFVTHRIICENIEAARSTGACDTVIPATDTIVHSEDGKFISSIPKRREYFQGQTPQSFNLKLLKTHIESLSAEEKEILTDACKIFTIRGEKVALVMGDSSNMKITYPQDMRLAHALIGE